MPRSSTRSARARGRGRGRRTSRGSMPAQLRRSYVSGKVAARIGWGSSGDFRRCTAQAAKHGVPARMRKGMCARLHRAATGKWPGRNRGH
ncbi:hypothetical protein [Actinomycetospora aeridis]|uniref:Uncharacterized protein n=1 Tax=Actinomycetospora aeridis TaxID=3129231 RepID=A0ABU8N1A5_9PSEU